MAHPKPGTVATCGTCGVTPEPDNVCARGLPMPPTFNEATICPNDGATLLLVRPNIKECPTCGFVHGRSSLFVGED